AVPTSKKVGGWPSAASSSAAGWAIAMHAARSSFGVRSRVTLVRSRAASRCGDVEKPVREAAGRGSDSSIAPGEPLPLLLAERVQQGPHAVELEVARLRRGPLEIDAAEPVGQGLVVGHECSLATLRRSVRDGPFGASLTLLRSVANPNYPCTGMHTCSSSRS